jgi:ATP-binding cassette subfamily D (ALD) long-chain fatty acid import protein
MRCPPSAELTRSTELDAEKRLALQEEKQELEHKLLEVPKMRARLEELRAVKAERERQGVAA